MLKTGATIPKHRLCPIVRMEAAPGAGWRTHPIDAAQTCVPFPYGARPQDQYDKNQPVRQDLLAATERQGLQFCAARPGVPLHAGAAETYRFCPLPVRGQVQSAGAAIIRNGSRTRRSSITQLGKVVGNCVPNRHKKSKGRDNIPDRRYWDTQFQKCTAPLQVPSFRTEQNKGWQHLYLKLKKLPIFLSRHKELLLFIYVRRLCRAMIIPHNGLFWFLLSGSCHLISETFADYLQE